MAALRIELRQFRALSGTLDDIFKLATTEVAAVDMVSVSAICRICSGLSHFVATRTDGMAELDRAAGEHRHRMH